MVHFADEPDVSYWSAFEEILDHNGIAFSTDDTLGNSLYTVYE